MYKNEKLTWGAVKDNAVNQLLKVLEEAKSNNWQYKKSFFGATQFPYNPVSGTRYTGINTILLLSKNFPDPRFITAAQVSQLYKESNGEIKIMKGSKSSQVCFFSIVEKQKIDKATKEVVYDESGRPVIEKVPVFKYHNVFNFSQITGPIDQYYPPPVVNSLNDNETDAFVDEVVEAMKKDGLQFHHHTGASAFYRPSTDSVHVPHLNQFDSTSAYCRTVLHEIGHATGHTNRLNRDQSGPFGSSEYAYEELVAEFYSFFMNLRNGHAHQMQENHGAYANHWLEVLSSDREVAGKFVITAISEAKKAFEYVENKVLELKVSKENKAQTTDNLQSPKKLALSM